MAKKSSVEKEKRRAKLVKLGWEKRTRLRELARSLTISEEERVEAQIQLNKMPRDTSYIRKRNRCQLTGRARGYLRKFKLSRLCFRELANMGYIPGVFKASW